jgi:hypothetical protein
MNPEAQALDRVLQRELETVRAELLAFPDEAQLWSLPAGCPNSAGTLALHVCGNLQHFIGSALGGTGYVRDRAREFAARGLSRAELLSEIDAAQAAVHRGLAALDDATLAAPYRMKFAEFQLPARVVLGRLLARLTSHLGQIDIHRRLATDNPKAIDPPPISQLAE